MNRKNLRCERCGKPCASRVQRADTEQWVCEDCGLPKEQSAMYRKK